MIGLGGIGGHLAEPLCRTLVFSKSERSSKRVLFVDGDAYEERNRERQRFTITANKAEVTKELLEPLFSELTIEAKYYYVDESNIYLFVKEDDTVFLAVDNHAVRKLVSDHVKTLSNALLISGGNELHDGNIQIYERREGQDHTPPLTYLHPEIESPVDKNPAELACGTLVETGAAPQILTVNLTIATLMLNAYTLWLEGGDLPYTEVYFDLRTGNIRPSKVTIEE